MIVCPNKPRCSAGITQRVLPDTLGLHLCVPSQMLFLADFVSLPKPCAPAAKFVSRQGVIMQRQEPGELQGEISSPQSTRWSNLLSPIASQHFFALSTLTICSSCAASTLRSSSQCEKSSRRLSNPSRFSSA